MSSKNRERAFTAAGPQLVEKLINKNFEVFLDLKFHDIPNTVANACKVASNLGVWMINVHALGGKNAFCGTRSIAFRYNQARRRNFAYESRNDDLSIIGLKEEPESLIQKLSNLARSCGLDGVVCSGLETAQLRQTMGKEFCLVTPEFAQLISLRMTNRE